jgi:hypothetical protein
MSTASYGFHYYTLRRTTSGESSGKIDAWAHHINSLQRHSQPPVYALGGVGADDDHPDDVYNTANFADNFGVPPSGGAEHTEPGYVVADAPEGAEEEEEQSNYYLATNKPNQRGSALSVAQHPAEAMYDVAKAHHGAGAGGDADMAFPDFGVVPSRSESAFGKLAGLQVAAITDI